MSHPLEARLREGAAQLGLDLGDAQLQTLLDYLDWLARWNRVYNLTAVRDPHEMLTHHLLDCLAVIPPLRRELAIRAGERSRLLDVGSGGGLPGVVIAVACPEVTVDCVDTVAKKALFVQQVAAALRLPNLRGVHARVETLSDAYDIVTARAFAALPDLVRLSRAVLKTGGAWLAMKGKRPDEEIRSLPEEVEVFHVEPLQVPGLDADRCIVWMRPRAVAH